MQIIYHWEAEKQGNMMPYKNPPSPNDIFKMLFIGGEIKSIFFFCQFRFSSNFNMMLPLMFVTSTQNFPVQLQLPGFQNRAYAASQSISKAKYKNGDLPKQRLKDDFQAICLSILKCRNDCRETHLSPLT